MTFQTWEEARKHAQEQADKYGQEMGLEKRGGPFPGFSVFMLPAPQFRQGRELTCETVSPSKVSK